MRKYASSLLRIRPKLEAKSIESKEEKKRSFSVIVTFTLRCSLDTVAILLCTVNDPLPPGWQGVVSLVSYSTLFVVILYLINLLFQSSALSTV